MKNGKTVVIPLALLIRATLVLEYIDFFGYIGDMQSEYDKVLFAFRTKKATVELRSAYDSLSGPLDSNLCAIPNYSQFNLGFTPDD